MTHDELAGLDKFLSRREKNAKAWTFMRWISIPCGLWMLGLGLWIFTRLPEAWHAAMPKDFNEPVDAFTFMSANIAVMHFSVLWSIGLFQVALGAWVTIGLLAQWRKGHHDRLLVKMARCWMESQQPAPPSAPQ